MKKLYVSPNAPKQADYIAQVSIDEEIGLAFVSGLISQKPDGTLVRGTDIKSETTLVLTSLKGIVEDMGLTMDHVIKCNIFLSNWLDFEGMCEVYNTFFSKENPPARQTVVCSIWDQFRIEISAEITLR